MFKMNETAAWAVFIVVVGAVVMTGLITERFGENKKRRPCRSIPISSIKAKGVVLKMDGSELTIQTANDVVKETSNNFYQVIQEGDTIK